MDYLLTEKAGRSWSLYFNRETLIDSDPIVVSNLKHSIFESIIPPGLRACLCINKRTN
jgi:hypothetical protein